MKTKFLFTLMAGCLLALAAWLVHVPNPAEAGDIPEKYRDTVNKGLEYLAKNQSMDGHWEGKGGRHPVAMTGLVGLALLMEGGRNDDDWNDRPPVVRVVKYSANVRKAVDWLVDKSQAKRDGLIFSEHASETARYMEGHGLAMLFLAAACKQEKDLERRKKLIDVLTKAVKYIVKAQSTQGGWYHTSKMEGHDFDSISATVIQMQALRAAEYAGVPVPRTAMNDAKEYLKKAMEKYEEAKPGQSRREPTDTPAALACGLNWSPFGAIDEVREKWLKYCRAQFPVGHAIEFGHDELIYYYFAQALFNFYHETWLLYRADVFDRLQASQNKDGSWPAGDGLGVGPVYTTAVWCTVLQLDKKGHPLTPPPEPVRRK